MEIFFHNKEEIKTRIDNKDIKICVIGVGTIGLPLATMLAEKGFQVTGLDISSERVELINSGKVIYEYRDILEQVAGKKLVASTDPKISLENAEIIFVCVPTPLNQQNEMDIKNLVSVVDRIHPFIKKGMMIIFESSVAIGTTRKISKLIEEKTGFVFGKDLGLAYCPERYNPTPMKKKISDKEFNIESKGETFTVDKISRVVGGIDEKSSDIAHSIYSQFITTGVTKLSSIETAEATKLVENIFRDVNIALVNEFAKIFPKFDLDIFEIINAAKSKPFAFMPHYPGAGVGGECIPVDTWYLISQAEKIGLNTELMKVARKVNDSMPEFMLELLEIELVKHGKQLSDSKIAILGLCYKKNIPDIRLSPSLDVMKILENKGVDFRVCDPVYEKIESSFELSPLNEVFKGVDAILMITEHDNFKELDFSEIKDLMRTPIIIDGRNFFSKNDLISLGFSYAAIGKPFK
ncbi:nucleotide sugar dehydrogenase [Candidatus Nitrosopelagicus sp.]|nr:nucleotide sugar dehydrogenase [Candidatus Nitrosopelagicus sp.]